jgi:hypothetical protein
MPAPRLAVRSHHRSCPSRRAEDDDSEDDAAFVAAKRAAASPALQRALQTFESNVAFYAQNPGAARALLSMRFFVMLMGWLLASVFAANVLSRAAVAAEELLKLSSSLPTAREQNDFLDILFAGTWG